MLSSAGEDRSTLLVQWPLPTFPLLGPLLLCFLGGLMLMLLLLSKGLLTASLDTDLLEGCLVVIPSLSGLGEILFIRECLGDRV